MRVSFIVLTYNHAQCIEQCLNSIVYQKERYGNGKVQIQLIVSDDCSKDETVDVVRSWIEHNTHCLDDVVHLQHEKNLGTCRNYLDALGYADGDYIKAVGGDDVFPVNSVFDIMCFLGEYDIVCGNPVVIYESHPLEDSMTLYKKYAISLYRNVKKPFRTSIHQSCWLIAPATYVKRDLLKHPHVTEMLQGYRFVDDYSQWLAMSELKDIKIKYLDMPAIVYMRRDTSTFKIRGAELQREVQKIYKYALETAPTRITKIFLRSALNEIQYPQSRLRKVINPNRWTQKFYEVKELFTKKTDNVNEIVSETVLFLRKMQEGNVNL